MDFKLIGQSKSCGPFFIKDTSKYQLLKKFVHSSSALPDLILTTLSRSYHIVRLFSRSAFGLMVVEGSGYEGVSEVSLAESIMNKGLFGMGFALWDASLFSLQGVN